MDLINKVSQGNSPQDVIRLRFEFLSLNELEFLKVALEEECQRLNDMLGAAKHGRLYEAVYAQLRVGQGLLNETGLKLEQKDPDGNPLPY